MRFWPSRGLLRELADRTGLSAQVTAALADTYRGPWVYAPGAVFADLAAAVADGADCIDGVGQVRGDREHIFGAKASTTTMWRLVDQRIDAIHLPRVRAARAAARAAAWAAGSAPKRGGWLHIDIDATLTIDQLFRGYADTYYSQMLARVVGPVRARDLMFTGRVLSAQEAMDWGMVARVVAHDDLLDTARGLLAQCCRTAPGARAVIKSSLDAYLGLYFPNRDDHEPAVAGGRGRGACV